ncbi:hypothetical protein [Sedimenticola sp.]|uniref:hypothetical protein n=1 Tax=Sedimenticola sp. TaxID=1940285 RepID=UPI002584FE73|nr:hypothetical protein [Sedimenticola sp.]MCW8905124.1 hypothetical protein [Sedimenticola sp.]
MCKFCWGSLTALLLVAAFFGYKFVYQGDTVTMSDGRLAIQLNSSERDLVLAEMRAFVDTLQAITQGIAREDLAQAAGAARNAGMAAQSGVPVSLAGKLPMEFKKLGLDTHRKFDQLALDAEQMEDPSHTLTQLSKLMQNCVGCHATYRIAIGNPQ